MAGFDGALALVCLETTEGSDTWEVVAAQTSFSTETTRNMLDGSIKGKKHAVSAYGRMESSASMEALVALGDGTQQRLVDAQANRLPVTLRYGINADDDTSPISFEHGFEAEALVGSISRTFPDNENSTFSVEFTINDPGWVDIGTFNEAP